MSLPCPGPRISRRRMLQIGAASALGLNLPALLRADEARKTAARADSCILIFLDGGPSHLDMWDPKPNAPAEYRGEFGVRPTSVPGIILSDMLPHCGQIMDKWSIIRSLHHNDAGHSSGDQICFTGYPAGSNPDENVHPSCGSIVAL